MRRLCLVVAALVSAVAVSAAVAQTSTTAPAPQAAGGKRVACREAVTSKQLKGQDRKDQMALCLAQAHLDCLKQAIDQKIVGPQRRDFIKSCISG